MNGKSISGDLRSRIVKASDEGMSARQAAARFGVGASSAIRWIAWARIGELAPRLLGRRRACSLDAHESLIVGMIAERKDITLNEMVARLEGEQSVRISRSALSAWRADPCLSRSWHRPYGAQTEHVPGSGSGLLGQNHVRA